MRRWVKSNPSFEVKPIETLHHHRALTLNDFMQQRFLVIDKRNNRAERYKLCDILRKFG